MKRQLLLLCFLNVGLVQALVASIFLEPAIRSGESGTSQLFTFEPTPEELVKLGGCTDCLRLFDASGIVVPYCVEICQEPVFTRAEVHTGRAIQVRNLEDGSLEIVYEADKSLWNPAHLQFHISLKDFEQQVQIWGMDGEKEQLLCGDGFIFDSSKNLAVTNQEVVFNPGTYKRFRIVLSQANLERVAELRNVRKKWNSNGNNDFEEATQREVKAFKIDSVSLWSEQKVEAGLVDKRVVCKMPVAKFKSGIEKSKLEYNTYSFQIPLLPLTGIVVDCPEKNFSRQVRIISDDANFKTEGCVSSISIGGYEQAERLVRFAKPVTTKGVLSVWIASGEQPLTISETSFGLETYQYRLLFVAEENQAPFKLSADPEGKKPKYDLENVVKAARNNKVMSVQLVKTKELDDIVLPDKLQVSTKMSKFFLYAVLILVVGAVSAVLIKSFKNLKL